MSNMLSGNFAQGAKELIYDYTGVIATGQTGTTSATGVGFNPTHALPVWLGIGAGVVVHKLANKVGVNRYVRRASMGFLEL